MTQFDNVSILKKSNQYFDGKVISYTILLSDGSRKTVGVMQPGDYKFSTESAENMEILTGDVRVKLEDGEWQDIKSGSNFNVPANSHFLITVSSLADYCCSYIEA